MPDKGYILARPLSWNAFKEKKPSSEGRRRCSEEHPTRSQDQSRVMLLSNIESTVLECFIFHVFGDKTTCDCASRGSWANAKPGGFSAALMPRVGC